MNDSSVIMQLVFLSFNFFFGVRVPGTFRCQDLDEVAIMCKGLGVMAQRAAVKVGLYNHAVSFWKCVQPAPGR